MQVHARMHSLEQERRELDKRKMEAYAARVAQQISRQESAAAAQEAEQDAEFYKQVRSAPRTGFDSISLALL